MISPSVFNKCLMLMLQDGSFNVPECLHAYLPNKTFNEEKSY